VFPTFGRFLLFALLMGMIRGIPWRLLPVARLGLRRPGDLLAAAAGLAARQGVAAAPLPAAR
jgi:hypothetical protein